MVYNFRILNNQSDGGLDINPHPYKCKSENRNGHFKTVKRSRNDVTTIYVDQACESLGVGHLEGEGRTLRHHPHLSTPTRIAEKNFSYFDTRIKQKDCNNKNILHQFKNLNMKCNQSQRLDIDVKNQSENEDVKKSTVQATEVTHEHCIKYEGNKRIKRKTIKTSEFNYTKTKTNIGNVDGSFKNQYENRNEKITKTDWKELNDLKTKRDQMPKYSRNNVKVNSRLHENWLDSKTKLNKEFYTRESSESTYHRKNRSTGTSQDETINTQSSESLEKSTLSSVESNRSNSPKHVANINVSSSDISVESPPIFIRKEQWPDIRCRMRILSKKETISSPTAVIRIKKLEENDSMHSSSSEQEWQSKSRKPTAKFKIRKTEEYRSFEDEKLTCKSPPSPTVMFRVKQPTFSDNKHKYSNTSENTISDETSTLSSISFQSSEDRLFTETRTNTENNNFYRTDSFSYIIPQKESSFEKDFSSEDYSTRSSKEEEIKYRKSPIEIMFKIKSYEEESSKSRKNTEKSIQKEYLKQPVDSKSSSDNMSKEIFTHLNVENKNGKKYEKFSDDRETRYELKEGETVETVRETSEIIECHSGSSKSREIISEIRDEKLKTDSCFTGYSTFNSEKSEPKFENSKYVDSQKFESKYLNYLNIPHVEKSENENEKVKNENSKEMKNKFKPIRFNNLGIYGENFSLTKKVEVDKINYTHNDDKYEHERSSDKIHVEEYPQTYNKFYNNYQEDSEFSMPKYSKLEESRNSEESNKSLTEIYEYLDMKSYKNKPDITKGVNSYRTTSYWDVNYEELNKQDEFSQSFHVKSNVFKPKSCKINYEREIPSRKYKTEMDKFTQTDKSENFEAKKKEILIINKYFDTESFENVTESSQIYSNIKIPKEKSDKNACTSPINSILKQPDAQKKHDTKELQDKYFSSKSNKDEKLILNTLEVGRDHKIYSFENLPQNRHKNNKSMASLCSNIEWHSINRKKDNKFLTSNYDRNFATEILTKKDTSIQSKYSNLNLEENNKNLKEKNNDHTIKQTENESINSERNVYINKKRFTHEIPTHPELSKVLATAGFHNEIRDEPMEQRKQSFKFEIYKNLQEKKQEEVKQKETTDEGVVKKICSVQAQLSHKGFRIKNWKEEVIIHRMLFTSVNRRELPSHDVIKPKNVITEKCFFVDDVRDVENTYKFTIFKNETTGRIIKFDSDFRNKSWDIFSTGNVKNDIKKTKIVTTKKATSLYVVWIPNYKKSFLNSSVGVNSTFDIEHLSSRHYENSVWASALLKESKSSAVSALLKSEWPTGGCSMSQEEKVPTLLSLVQPLTSFNLSCIQNSSEISQDLPPTVITSLILPTTVRSAKIKDGMFRLDTPTKVLQCHQRIHQSLPNLCCHEQMKGNQ